MLINKMEAAEILQQFTDNNWQTIGGISSLVLISVGGTVNSDYALAGQMSETVLLQRSEKLKDILKKLQRPLSRCRLIRLPTGEHSLYEPSFHRFIRQVIYIPLVHFSDVQFYAENQLIYAENQLISFPLNSLYQLAGSQPHKVVNQNVLDCVYLQIETLATDEEKDAPFLEPHHFEVLTPAQMHILMAVIMSDVIESALKTGAKERLQQGLLAIVHDWENVFNHFGKTWKGELHYQNVLRNFVTLLNGKHQYLTSQGRNAAAVIETMLRTDNNPKAKRHFSRYFFVANKPLPDLEQCPDFEKPIFIISAPRAGSTLLFEAVAQFSNVWTIGEESHELIEDISTLHPAAQNFRSNRLTAEQATPEIAIELKKRFVRQLRNREGVDYLRLEKNSSLHKIRFLEKTPKNALRIPFLKAIFPDALFIYLHRHSAETISSLLEGWRSQRFIAYRDLPNWIHQQWSFILPEGWQALENSSLATIAAYQWRACNETIENDLKAISVGDWCRVSYSDLVTNPQEILTKIARFAGLDENHISQTLPISRLTLSKPAANKWRKYETELNDVLREIDDAN